MIAKERMFGLGGNFHYLECLSCHGLFLQEIPSNLDAYYPENYYSFGSFNSSGKLSQFLKKFRYQLFKAGIPINPPNYFDWISNLSISENSKIADIGCGNGQLLAELSYCGFRGLHGYDPYQEKVGNFGGFTLFKKSFFEIRETYDLVMFHHSFEHLPNPVDVFKHLIKVLNPGGEVLIRVPVTNGKVWKEEREFWFQLDAPRHLFIPHSDSMKKLAESFGLNLYKTCFDSHDSQFWGTELYKRGKAYMGTEIKKEFKKEELSYFKQKALLYNKMNWGDQACFYLRKK
ncbi:class I SAM-dependent methyltransferase [Algoriphagus sp. YJ13C]|uniref:Class I SAM-dependent methyltransferase n=1 Tax=Algoriphagus pacificus TaxID=2811234 RepID=A0ABS3CAT9_9BACT|nr:class I SAM-dependent methyltransferase [Algoriphagus pacificus]